jgi:hypothetical protein
MKGMIFTELLDMLEDGHGLALKDRVLQRAEPESGGTYTAVGDYSAGELLRIVQAISAETGKPVSALLEAFGTHMFAHFTRHYGRFFANATSCFDFLGHVEDYIHVEVRKLYPEAELPSFHYPERSADRLVMEYRSPRPLAAFATGLVRAALAHFGERVNLSVEDLSEGRGTAARYTLTRAS